jgi:hypothetical protein
LFLGGGFLHLDGACASRLVHLSSARPLPCGGTVAVLADKNQQAAAAAVVAESVVS